MNWFRLLVGISACSVAHAQQPSAPSPAAPPAGTAPGISVLRPEFASPARTPVEATAADGTATLIELRDLIRAQSEAIRVMTGKVDALEDRLRRMEGKLR